MPQFVLLCVWAGTGLFSSSSMDRRALELARAHGVSPTEISFLIVGPDGAHYGHRERTPMPPASNLKLVTAAAALDRLGTDFRFRTDLLRTGSIMGGALRGDLIVVGRADPGISGRYHGSGDPLAELRPWAGLLRELGVERVTGRVVGDDRYLAGENRLPEWPRGEIHRWYCAPSGALTLNDNCVDVRISPSPDRSSIQIVLAPKIPRFSIRGKIEPASREKDHRYRVDRAPESWEILVGGHFLRSVRERVEWVTVPDPTVAFLEAVSVLFADEGIPIEGGIARGAAAPDAVRVGEITRTLGETVPVLLKRSQNLYADCILRTLGRERGGDGSYLSGAEELRRYLEQHGVAEAVAIRDGSGLSAANRLTTVAIVTLLEAASRRPWQRLFFESLPVSGRDGTLRRRFQNSPVRDRVWAKTGHIQGVTTLSGRLQTPSGWVLFSLFFSGRPARVAAAERWQRAVLEEVAAHYRKAPAATGSGRREMKGPRR